MAADSKHCALQVAPLLCENQSYNSQEKGTRKDEKSFHTTNLFTGCYPWQAELQGTLDHRAITDILERRSAEVRRLYEQCENSADGCRHLEQEWLALVMEKDRNLRQQIEQENEEAKRNQIKQLYGVLESLGTFSFEKPNEAILKRNLAKMYQQVGKYCHKNNIDITKKTSDGAKSVQAPNENVDAAPLPPQMLIPPPPPPPPLALTPFSSYSAPKQKACKTELRKSCTPSTKAHPSTPSNRPNEELLKRIRNACQSELRSTPFKRSPGGTPLKRQRRMSENDTSDLITVALKRKFQNAVFQSPKESDSPRSVTSPGDLN